MTYRIRGIRRIRQWGLTATIAAVVLTFSAPAWAASRPDAWITTKAKISLLTTEGISSNGIHVDTTDGQVTLHGSVPSTNEKTKAVAVVRDIEGVRQVRDLLQVVPEAAEKFVAASDDELEARVEQAMKKDEALEGSSIRVGSVNAGVVLLEGNARTLSAHRRAIEVAARLDGVKRVASNIESPDELGDAEIWQEDGSNMAESAGSAVGDLWITSAAKIRLMGSSETPALAINVDTSDGIVTLFGTVPSAEAKKAATREVRKVSGVRSVNNELQVVAEKNADRVAQADDVISSAVEKRLESRGDLEGSDIDVEVKDGVARLTGSVASQVDRMAALTTTSATSGVRAVLDDLEIVGPPAVSSR